MTGVEHAELDSLCWVNDNEYLQYRLVVKDEAFLDEVVIGIRLSGCILTVESMQLSEMFDNIATSYLNEFLL